jgi:copper chaperone
MLPTRVYAESNMEEIFLRIGGMSCEGCVNSVRNALARLPGVQVERVEVGSARVAYDPSLANPESVRRAIVNAGFEPQGS